MNLNSRLSRIEAAHTVANPNAVIVATDEADFLEQLETVLLGSKLGLLTVSGTIAGQAFEQTAELLPHETTLELPA